MESEAGRSERKKREARERILGAAASLFTEKGARAASMDEVAEKADVARRTLFNYFPSKDELLFAVAAPLLEEAVALAEARLAEESGGSEDIIGICLALWRSCGRRLEILYSVDLEDSPRLALLHGRYLEAFSRIVARAAAREPVLATRARLVGKLVYRSFVPLLRALEGEADAEARFAAGLRGLIEGAAGEAPQPRP